MNFLLPFPDKKIDAKTIERYLIPGSIILTNNYRSKTFIVTPSPIKHGAIYFGKNIYKAIQNIHKKLCYYIYLKEKKLLSKQDYNEFFEIEDIIDIYSLKNELKILLEKENKTNEKTIVEISDKGPRILTLYEFLKNKNEIFIYYYKNLNYMKIAREKSLYFLGTTYSFMKNKNGKYCFEMIIKSYELSDKNFIPLKVSIAFDYHYTSSCFTRSLDFTLVYKN